MTRVLVATRNKGKRCEIEQLVTDLPYEFVFLDQIGLHETTAEQGLEIEDTFEGNARRKAEYFHKLSGLPTVGEDSGLEAFALAGLPGVRSRRFAMATENQDEANNEELLRRLAGAPTERRGARYQCALVFIPRRGAVPVTFKGMCAGRVLEAPRGQRGFGYDPLFYSEELGKTFGEATLEEKQTVSHRARAFGALADWLMTPGNEL